MTLFALAREMEDVRYLRAEYAQFQKSILRPEPITSRGLMHVRTEPGCIVLELRDPRPVWIRADATTHQVYHPTQKRAERFLFKSNELAKALLSFFGADIRALETTFKITDYTVDEDAKRAQYELIPKWEELAKRVRRLSLTVDLKTYLPIAIEQVSPDNDGDGQDEELRFELSNIERNPKPTPGETPVFDRPLPKDTQVVEHEVETNKDD